MWAESWNQVRTGGLRTVLQILGVFQVALVLGINDSGFGIVLPFFRNTHGVSEGLASLVYIMSSAGFVISSFLQGWFADRLGVVGAVCYGIASTMAAYCLLASPTPFGVALPTFILLGFSLCFIDNGINTVSLLFPAPLSTVVLNYTHAFFGVGGLIGPPVVTSILIAGGCNVGQGEAGTPGDSCPPDVSYLHTWRAAYIVWIGIGTYIGLFVAGAYLTPWGRKKLADSESGRTEGSGSATSVTLLDDHVPAAESVETKGASDVQSDAIPLEDAEPVETAKSKESSDSPASQVLVELSSSQKYLSAIRKRHVWVGTVFLFVYVGCEVSIGQWIFTFLSAYRPAPLSTLGPLVSLFWSGLVISRILFVPLTHRLGQYRSPYLYMVMSLIGIALVWAFNSIPVNGLGLLLAGLGQGPLFPTAIAVVADEITNHKLDHLMSASLALVVAGGNVGGAFVPWVVGLLAQSAGVWTIAPICLALNVAMAVCWVGMR
ncbi:MFS general substrate transporter [Gonapodya prolifera JEL478]|uniref:MFS general substrate transporter n=1 Tax=Gonapodya prolifera (strain JEL478) TaxID=1344416 RepID=A0A139AIR5_GONPJ|nr:MFS general substrate transporter [Gonapodya prolifera JEL478]|eukprot:KXS16687.1 MFS general substrate transporter [Gonapodya prolifera JEL478]